MYFAANAKVFTKQTNFACRQQFNNRYIRAGVTTTTNSLHENTHKQKKPLSITERLSDGAYGFLFGPY